MGLDEGRVELGHTEHGSKWYTGGYICISRITDIMSSDTVSDIGWGFVVVGTAIEREHPTNRGLKRAFQKGHRFATKDAVRKFVFSDQLSETPSLNFIQTLFSISEYDVLPDLLL